MTIDVAGIAGVAFHHPVCAVPMSDPTMNISSVTIMRVFPPPTANSVPDAQPPPSCIPTPKMNAPAITETPAGDTEPRIG